MRFPKSISSITLGLTESCNFSCLYCRQFRSNSELDWLKILNFFKSFLPKTLPLQTIHFYGGEPLLKFEVIQKTVSFIEKYYGSNHFPAFSVSTNGMLLDQESLNYFNRKSFRIALSFDGTAQDESRGSGTFSKIIRILGAREKYPEIDWRIQSVFGPETVLKMSESVQLLFDLNLTDFTFYADRKTKWEKRDLTEFHLQVQKIRKLLVHDTKKNGAIRLSNFRNPLIAASTYTCGAGKKGLTMSVDGKLWGCTSSASLGRLDDIFSKYCYGDFENFLSDISIYRRITRRYRSLRMDRCRTDDKFCMECPDLPYCRQCPLEAAFVTNRIGWIPSWFCDIGRSARREKARFWREITS